MANRSEILKAVTTILATVGMIVFNWLAAFGYINNTTPGEISGLHLTIITPASYAFSIWSLIYFGLTVFSIYQALPRNLGRFARLRSLYILTCVVNCGWVFCWQHDAVILCLGIIFVLAMLLLIIIRLFRNGENYADYWFVSAPFSLYAGWVTAAMIVNLVIALGSLGVTVSGPGATILGIICILGAATLGVTARVKLTSYLHPLAVAWALTAIGVKQSGQTLVVSAAAIGVIACLIATCSFVLNLNSSTTANEQR